jgi:hypothetical protein
MPSGADSYPSRNFSTKPSKIRTNSRYSFGKTAVLRRAMSRSYADVAIDGMSGHEHLLGRGVALTAL